DIAFMSQDIGLMDSETSDNETYNFSPLSQLENLQFVILSNNDNKNDNMKSDKDYKTEEESEEEDIINFDIPDTNIFILSENLKLDGSIDISLIINQYRRVRISDEVFRSTFSKWHKNSSRILAKFAEDGDVITYSDEKLRYQLSISKNDDKLCNVKLWNNDFYDLDRNCIIPVYNILGRFVASTFTIRLRKPQ
ncbi:7325_t:CDS:2, partial [Scutellospora calospora]